MKNFKFMMLVAIVLLTMVFYSCHSETPVNVDYENPEVQRIVMFNSATTDTLYDSQFFEINTDTAFVDFQYSLKSTDGDLSIVISTKDNGNLYNLTLFAEDPISKISYAIKNKSINSDGEYLFSINVADLPTVQVINPQKFYLYFSVVDDTENISNSDKLGFNFEKRYLQNKIYEEFGQLENTAGDSINFSQKAGELTFIQFLADG